ncbi:MAG: hypothetical protein ABEJ67_04890 [Halanaeroarchaeum sp.]
MRLRDVAVAIGVIAGVTGVVVAARPGLASDLSVPVVPTTVTALLSFALVVVAYVERRDATVERPAVASVEEAGDPRSPGIAAERLIQGSVGTGSERERDRRSLASRLRTAAVRTLVETEGIDEATARERLAAGTWTDDPRARSYFREDSTDRSFRATLAEVVTGDRTERKARAVVRELHRRMEDHH